MNKSSNNINEEINRIKSLFTEERMYGNLVEDSYQEVIKEGVIKTGSDSDVVKPLQRLLGVEDDGVFGPKTKEALEKFQRENGLKDDGIADEETVKVLNKKFNIKEGSESVISEQDDQTAKDVETINKEVLGDESETVEVDSEETPEVKVTGCIKGDCENGQGTYNWPNGDKYMGNWEEGKMTGQGTYTWADGSIYHSGLWKDNVPVKTDETNTDGNGNEDNSEEKSTTPDTETPKDNSEEKSTTTDTETPKDDSEETVKDKIKDKKEDEVSEKETVKTDFKGCKKIITDAIKLANDGNSMEDAYKDKSDDKRLEIEGCLGKYYNSFEKIGFMKKGKGVSLLKRLWDIEVKKDVDGGKMGEKYQIMVNNRSRGTIKKVGKNEYRLFSKPKETIFGRDKNFKDGYKEAVFNSLDLNPNDNDLIVAGIIQKGPIQWAKLLRRDV
jgi:peptidoglycan hydrolase-like protein with peptidoglycan-binding domain